jgi:acyl-CoA thioesterase-1
MKSTFLRSILLVLCLWAGLPLQAQAAQQTILVFGDSLSAAYGIAREAGWVSLLQKDLQKTHPRYQIVNASVSGETTTGGKQRLAAALRQYQPAIVMLELGANDGLRGAAIDNIEANLSTLIEQSQKSGAKVLLLGIQLPPNYGGNYTTQFKNMYTRLAQQYRIPLVPFLLEGMVASQFQRDALHPNAQAQKIILRNVMQELQPLL